MAPQNNRRKIQAVLAGGLVLGVGAAITLAAWNDSEFASGIFSAGSFNLEGSTQSATEGFTDHPEGGSAADLEFTLPLAQKLAPEDVVHAPFWVRLDAGTTTSGNLETVGVTATGENVENLSYTIHAIAPADSCDESTTAGAPIAAGATLATLDTATGIQLAAGEGQVAGEAVQLCFTVTAGLELVQGEGAVATWQFAAESD